MSDRREKIYSIRFYFDPEFQHRNVRARSEEEAVEKFRDEYNHEMLHNWIKVIAQEEEVEE